MSRYPSSIVDRLESSAKKGKLFVDCELSFRNVKYVGTINRFKRWKSSRVDDKFFIKYTFDEYKLSPREKWTLYGLAHANELALLPSILKYDKPNYPVDMTCWNNAISFCQQHFHFMYGVQELEPDDEVFALMEPMSSPGFPYTFLGGNKKSVLALNGVKDSAKRYNILVEHQQTPVLWAVHEKEEIRALEKLEANRIRTFVGSSLDFLFACMCMFYTMNERLYRHSAFFDNWNFVGATKFYGGWNTLFKRLNKHPNAFELDEEDYDCSISAEMLETIAFLRANFLGATKNQKRKIFNLYREIIDSYMVLPGGEILMKNRGNPSGSFNTITDNSLVLYLLLAYAWILLAPDDLRDYVSFHANVEAALCGDDNTFTVSDQAVGFFNARSISSVWTHIGIKTKTDFWDPRPLKDCWFLSNAFKEIVHPILNVPFVVPCPEAEKVVASLAFHAKGNVRWSLLRAAALRIDSFYNEVARFEIWRFIEYLQLNFQVELNAKKDIRDPLDIFTYDQIKTVLKTDYEIQLLYVGCCEGSSLKPFIDLLDYGEPGFGWGARLIF